VHPVESLWEQLAELPTAEYPPGVVPLPGQIGGTAFFSAGAGLCRATGDRLPEFPFGGVMFVGHNLDAEGPYLRRLQAGVPHGDPERPMAIWRNLYALLDGAGVGREECFFTNVYVGLIAGDKPTGSFPGARSPSFTAWCRGFLQRQVELMRPRAMVFLGKPARAFVGLGPGLASVTFGEMVVPAVGLAHPSMHPSSAHNSRYGEATGVAAEVALLQAVVGQGRQSVDGLE
jgi:hypothetical protein